jgi:hypothetical protein
MASFDDMAKQQRGYLALAQANEAGLSRKQASRLVRDKHFQRPHPGVYKTGSAPPEWEDKVRAACLAAGVSRAMGRTAARLRGLDGNDRHGIIELTVPKGHGPVPAGVLVHETRRLEAALTTHVRGIPVSSINQTLLELAWLIRADLPVERALEDALRRHGATEGGLRRFLAGCGRGVNGVAHLRRVLDSRAGGRPARSGFEVIVFDIIRSAGLDLPIRRPLVAVPPDQKFELDLAYVERKIDIEAMGDEWHSTPRQRRRDAERRCVLEALGWIIIEVWWTDAIFHPENVVAAVRTALLSGSCSP